MTSPYGHLEPFICHYIDITSYDDRRREDYNSWTSLEQVTPEIFSAYITDAIHYASVMVKVKADQLAVKVPLGPRAHCGILEYGPTSDTVERYWPRCFRDIIEGLSEDKSHQCCEARAIRPALLHYMAPDYPKANYFEGRVWA